MSCPTNIWRCVTPMAVILSAGLALTACDNKQKTAQAPANAPAASAPDIQKVIIGASAPLTGGQAHLGKDSENGVELAILEANAKGPMIGGKKVQFVMMSEDDEADPKKGPVIAQKFVDAKVSGVVGHLNSGVSIPASTVYSQAGIPQISASSTNPQYTEQGYATTFRTLGRDDQQGPAIAQYMLQHKAKKIALVDDATAYGNGLANEVEKTLKAAKVKVFPREQGTDKTVDWKSILTKIKGEKPDAVFYGGMDNTGAPLLKQARELGIKSMFAFGDGGCTPNMVTLVGPASEGMLCSQAGVPPTSASASFLSAFKARFNTDPVLYSPFSYDAARILIQAMEKAGSSDPKVYLQAVKDIDYYGATGHIQFDSKGDRKLSEVTIYSAKGDKLEPIAVVKDGKSIPVAEFKLDAPSSSEPATTPASSAPASSDTAKPAGS